MFPSMWFCGAAFAGAALCASAATTYDLSSEFSPSANPAGPWTLGAKTNLSSSIVPFGVKGTTSLNGTPIQYWQLVPAQEPTIYHNGTASTAAFGTILTAPPGTVWLYAGVTASPYAFGAVRFTVPAGGAGTYVIESAVAPIYDGPPQGDTDFHVVHNGVELFGQFLAPVERTSYTNAVALAVGDTIDFLVGRGADNNNYGSGLKLKARLINNDPTPPADLVANGSFEQGINPGISTDVTGPDSTSITGWTIENASVDYIGTRWVAGDGARCLDISGTDAATISQMISGLTPGQTYRLSFLMAANPEVGTYVARLRAVIGSANAEFQFSQPGITTANLGWSERSVEFTASAPSHKLSLISLNPGWAGAALDKVSITPTTNPPPPPGWLAEYDLSSGFSTSRNPNGAWSFGWTETLSSAFNLLTYRADFASENGVALTDWRVSATEIPGVTKVVGAGVAVSAGGAFTAPSGTVYATPGNDGTSRNFSTIRFTVPASEDGIYRIESDVKPIFDGPLSGDSDFHVVKNGQELFGIFLPPNTPGGFTNQLTLRAGDTIDFVTGRGADGLHADRTALKVRAWLGKAESLPPVPPTSSLVQNGSFEQGVNPGVSADLPGPDSTSITGWTIENASVDYIGTRWIAGDGARCLDLSGTDAATISQMISGLVPGHSYRLSFLMAANPEVSTYVARLRATIGSARSEFQFSQPGITTANLGWTLKSMTFVASSSSHKLSLISLNPGWAGAALDKVQITELEPLVVNGSFEQGTEPGISTDLPGPDSTSIRGWTIENASVDYIGTRWVAVDGVRCLDLSGTDAATISQTVTGLTPGQAYRLSFFMAANPEVGSFTSRLRATIADANNEFSFLQSGFTVSNLGWTRKSLIFTASASSHKLSFTSLNPGWAGAALDNVSIVLSTNTPPPPPPPVGLVANGSFEQGIEPGVSTDLPGPDSTSITGWTIETASVDYIGSRWVAGDGVRCLDLSGTDAATISQTISGLTPGQTYRLSFLMAANPEVGQFTAVLQATIGTASRRFSFTQTGFTTANLGWAEKIMYFRATEPSLKLSFKSLNPGWAGAALDKIQIAVELNPPSLNTAPIAKALATPIFTVWPDQTNLMVVAVNGYSAATVLDGSLSSDADGDPLSFYWTLDDEGSPFANTVLTTNSLSTGLHHVTLIVDDGEDDNADTLEIEIITLDEALDEISGAIVESELLRKDKRPLFVTLDRVSDSFEKWHLEGAIRQLRVFQQKVRAQVAGHHPELAARLIGAGDQLIEALESYLESHDDSDKSDRK